MTRCPQAACRQLSAVGWPAWKEHSAPDGLGISSLAGPSEEILPVRLALIVPLTATAIPPFPLAASTRGAVRVWAVAEHTAASS